MGLAQKAGALLVRAGKFLSHCLCCCTGSCPTGVSECSPHCQCSAGQCVPCRETACPNGQQDCGPGCTCSGGQCVGCAETACPNGNECGEGCVCVDGECVECPQIVSYGGETVTFFIGDACSGEGFNNDPEGQAAIAQAWMDAIAEWMNANGYTNATGGATAPTEPSCTACVGPDNACDLWGSVTFGVSACCDGVQEEDYGPEWLYVFGDVFPGQDPPFYWQSFSGNPDIPPCIPNELP